VIGQSVTRNVKDRSFMVVILYMITESGISV